MEYLHGLLQPWRRVGRAEFVLVLTILSLPSLAMLLGGLVQGGAGALGPILDAKSHWEAAKQGQAGAIEALAAQLGGPAVEVTPASPTPTNMTNDLPFQLPALVNGLCLLLLTPFLRGRLLDMGYTPKVAMVGSWLLQLSVLNDTLRALTEKSLLPYGWAFALLTMVGYFWLTVRGGQAKKAVHERRFQGNIRPDDDYPRL